MRAGSYVSHFPPPTEIIGGASGPHSYVDHLAPPPIQPVPRLPHSYIDHWPPVSWKPNGGQFFFGGIFNLPDSNLSNYYKNNPYGRFTQPSADGLYAMITGTQVTPAQINWTAIDNAMAFCRANPGFKFIWYGGFINSISATFPANYGLSGPNLVTWWENVITQAAARYPDLATYCYFNYCNEGLGLNGTGNWESAFGGVSGNTMTFMINMGNYLRSKIPAMKIGINDFAYEATNGVFMVAYQTNSVLNTYKPRISPLISAGVLDWIGMEGYGLETITSAALTDALNQVGALGVKVVYTEFSPGSYNHFSTPGVVTDPAQNADASWPTGGSNQVSAWKRLLPLLAPNRYCIGIAGPWVGAPAGGSLLWSGSNPPTDTPAMTWIKSAVL